jgi:hypothetical protein
VGLAQRETDKAAYERIGLLHNSLSINFGLSKSIFSSYTVGLYEQNMALDSSQFDEGVWVHVLPAHQLLKIDLIDSDCRN